MQERGSANLIAGSWAEPFGLELRDFSIYPYSIFRFRWINYKSVNDKRYVVIFVAFTRKLNNVFYFVVQKDLMMVNTGFTGSLHMSL